MKWYAHPYYLEARKDIQPRNEQFQELLDSDHPPLARLYIDAVSDRDSISM